MGQKSRSNNASFLFSCIFPHSGNNHHPYLLRNLSLLVFAFIITINSLLPRMDLPSTGNILGYATNIQIEEIIRLTNAEREKNGLPPLAHNPALDGAAVQKASHMFSQGYWAHFAPDGTSPWSFFDSAGYKYTFAGENLAKSFNDSGGVVQAWMDSPTHRENILHSRYKEIGIAVVNGTLNGEETTLVVQFFGNPFQGLAAGLSATPAPTATSKPLAAITERSPTPQPTTVSTEAPIIPETPEEIVAVNTNNIAGQEAVSVQSFRADSWLNNSLKAPLNQQINIILLGTILILFIIDSVALSTKRIRRMHTGNTTYHILVIAGLLIVLLTFTKGFIL